MPKTVAANQNNNAIRFTDPDIDRDELKDFPCVSFSTFLESSRENFGQLVDDDSEKNGSDDIIRITLRAWAKFGVGTAISFTGLSNKTSGPRLLALVSSEIVNAFKKHESILTAILPNSQISEVPSCIDENVIVSGTEFNKSNPRIIYTELTALIEVRDKWA